MHKDFDFQKGETSMVYRRGILESLLVFSTSGSHFMLPTIKEFILSEVINGTIDYLGGKAGKLDYQKFRLERDKFEEVLNNYLEIQVRLPSRKKLHPKVEEAILKLCEPYWVDPLGPDKPYLETELYQHFKDFEDYCICPVVCQTLFSLPQEIVENVKKEILPRLSEHEKTDIKGIGKTMRKYINRDLEFIKKTYHW